MRISDWSSDVCSSDLARIVGDLPRWRAQSPPDDVDAGLLVVVGRLETVECLQRAEQSDAAARQDAFLDRGASGVERVIDTILLFLDLDFGRTADANDRDAAC